MKLSPSKRQEKLRELQDKLLAARKVRRTLETPGWEEIIQPLIDKMIQDTIGGKRGNIWSGGLVSTQTTKDYGQPLGIEYLIGYKQFGMDISNRLWNYVNQIENLEQIINEMVERDKNEKKDSEGGGFKKSPYAPR